MEKTWRWFGRKDKITLQVLRQIGVEGIVTALHDVPNGDVWTYEDIIGLRDYIESEGLRWSVVESLPVSEAIKYGGAERDTLIANYIESLANLGRAGIRTVCYNFMPVIDWVRTDLHHPWPDGGTSLYYDRTKFAYFDLKILARKGAEADWPADVIEKVEAMDKTISREEKDSLVDSIIVKTQGFVNGNISEKDLDPVGIFRSLLARYENIDRAALRANMKYFLEAVMPVCREYGVNLCVHPDDPPFQILGLPRIVTCEEDIEWFLNAVPDPHNGLTFCAGSLSAGEHNDTVALARKFASRTHFVHLRSTEACPDGNFIESSHLKGRGHLIDLIRIFEKANPDLPMRVDHGRDILGDQDRGYNPGYSFYGRMLALAQVDGMMATVRNELAREGQFSITGRVAIVTGGSGVLGSNIARDFLRAGAKVLIVGAHQDRVEKALESLKADIPEDMRAEDVLDGCACDVIDIESLKKVKDRVMEKWGRIDILVNAAGGNIPGGTLTPDQNIFNMKVQDMNKVVNLNLYGSVYPCLVFGEVMAAQGSGSIVNISSMAAYEAITRVPGYSIAKSGIENFTRWLAQEMAIKFSDKIRVNAIAPGFFIGNQNRAVLINPDGSYTERSKKVIAKTPMGRFGDISELNGAVQFLCSDAASFITGAVLAIDGGFSSFSGV